MIENYKNPINDSKLKILFNLIFIIIWTFLTSSIYSILIILSPLVYVNLFITFGFAILITLGFQVSKRIFPIFNKSVILTLVILSSFFALYFSWEFYILYLVTSDDFIPIYFKMFGLVYNPISLLQLIVELNNQGAWSIFGIPFNGLLLAFVWLIETVIIILYPFLYIKSINENPYSKLLNKWYGIYIIKKDFKSQFNKNELELKLSKNILKTINSFGNGKASNFSRVTIFYLDNEEYQYLSIENIRKDLRNPNREVRSFVIENQKILRLEAQNLIEFYKLKKSLFNVF